jgi:hypothetical protein
MNRSVEQVLRAHAADKRKDWDKSLCMVEFAINNSMHTGIKQSPFFLNYGQHPITPIMLEAIKDNRETCAKATATVFNRQQALDFAMQQLKIARDRYKSYADLNRKDTEFKVGEQVLLSTVNLNKHNQCRKLYPKYVRPFTITEQVNEVAYKLDLPKTMKIHNVFHVSLLKSYVPGRGPAPPPCPIEINGELEYVVECLYTHRERTKGKKEYYVKWKGYGPEHCTWEPEAHLKNASECLKDYWADHKLKAAQAIKREADKKSRKRPATSKPDSEAPAKKAAKTGKGRAKTSKT